MNTQDKIIIVRRFNNDSDELRATLEKCTIPELLERFDGGGQAPHRRGMKDATYKRVIINKLVTDSNKITKFTLQQPNGISRKTAKMFRKNNINDIEVLN